MSRNLQISLTMMFNGSAVGTGLDGVRRRVGELGAGVDGARRRFTELGTRGRQALSELSSKAREVHASMNGFGVVSQVAGAYGAMVGANTLKSVIDDNLEFERTLLKIKFNAQATTKELAQMRQASLDLSKDSLNSPLEVLQMHQRFANAGLKNEQIRKLAPAVANAAQVFEAPAGEIADMVFDMVTKTNIKEDRVPQMLDMLYYHATSGRFETKDMARQAPLLLNAGQNVGLKGEGGLNLLGALTQRLMRNATVQTPSEVTVMAEHGLSDLTSPHYVKGLKHMGIDLKSFFDKKGHFKGEDGVEGIVALTKAMKQKGLDNPFKLGEAGFREQHTRTFWIEMMRALEAKDTDADPNLLSMVKRGETAKESGQLKKNLVEMKESNSGKIKGAEIERQKVALSKPAGGFTSIAASVTSWASENMGTALLAGAGALLAGKLGYAKLKNGMAGKAGGGAAEGAMGGLAGAMGVQRVFVTNFPSSMLSPREILEGKRERMPSRDGTPAVPSGAPTPQLGRLGSFLGGMKGAMKIGGPVALAMGLIEGGMIAADGDMDKDTKRKEYKRVAGSTVGGFAGSAIGGAVGALFGGVGAVPGAMIGGAVGSWGGEKLAAMFDKMSEHNKQTMDELTKKPIPIDVRVTVENGNIAAEIDDRLQRQALRK